jgi:hypothetical protein
MDRPCSILAGNKKYVCRNLINVRICYNTKETTVVGVFEGHVEISNSRIRKFLVSWISVSGQIKLCTVGFKSCI